ncbi:MAG: N-acetyltransferase family protein [Pseudomonadota bacterium]
MNIRRATAEDAADMLAIYTPLVEHTTVSFELEPPTLEDYRQRIATVNQRHEWLVATANDETLGFAYGTVHRHRAAYQRSAETSVYVHEAHRGKGVARQLYERLFERLAELGYYNAYAGITLPNDASVAFHAATGFSHIGVFPAVGFKFGEWRDTSWWHRQLRTGKPA